MRNAFSLFDRDGDGSINSKVFSQYMHKPLPQLSSLSGAWSSDENYGLSTFKWHSWGILTQKVFYVTNILTLENDQNSRHGWKWSCWISRVYGDDLWSSRGMYIEMTFSEVCLMYSYKVSDEEIEEAFKMFDRDNSGSINHNEVKWVSSSIQ